MTPFDLELLARRLPAALLINVGLGLAAYLAGTVRRSGLMGGLAVGIPIYLLLGPRGFVVLAAMFLLGTVLTRLGYSRKTRLGVAEERRGARGASHALANAGVAALCALAAWATAEELARIAFAGALATAAMDTAGSEVGPLIGRRTVSTRTWRAVPPGTEGAVSVEGTLAGLLAALVVAAVGWGTALYPAPGVVSVVAGALAGNAYEAFVGARKLLPHTWLNATNTLVGAAVAALVAWLSLS
jgi:uncharacterized protein (TIGR00297 family)